MSPGVSKFSLNALIDDYSLIPRSGARSGVARLSRAGRAAPVLSTAVGRRAIEAEACVNGADEALLGRTAASVLIHGSAAAAFTAWRSMAARWPGVGIDVAQERDRRSVESVHRSLALLNELPRSVPVTIALALGPGWRDALDLILARGRTVRYSVCGVDAPDAPALVDAIRTAVAERCAFSWSCGRWPAVTDPSDGPLPGILNVLLATAAALDGADQSEVGGQLARTDPVDVVDEVRDLEPTTARRVRTLLKGFGAREVGRVVDSLSGLDLLPKAGLELAC